MTSPLKAPFPWFGGKRRAASIVWSRFGIVRNYVEPFAGSLAVLLGNPHPPKTETVNDLDCYIANFWRAIAAAPAEVATFASWPVNEADLHARHLWLVNQLEFRERMKIDPSFFDVRIAGWWVWGISCWIGSGWCSERGVTERGVTERGVTERGVTERKRPIMAADRSGNGIHRKIPSIYYRGSMGVHQRIPRQIPRVDAMCDTGTGAHNTDDLMCWFESLRDRLRKTRVACGDWLRVLGSTPLGLTNNVPPGFITAVFLDPPYAGDMRDPKIYAQDCGKVSAAVRAWAIEHGNDLRLRIALCGYDGEHAMPDTWECVPWKAGGGYGNRRAENLNATKERIWFSPHCLNPARNELALFKEAQA